jgi:spermidine/putrescine-binding protein
MKPTFVVPRPLATLVLIAWLALVPSLAGGCKKDAAAPGADASATDKVVNVLLFSEYVPQDVVDDFKKESGIEAKVGTVESNEQLLRKLSDGGSVADYDVVNPSDYMVKRLAERNLVRKLDRDKLPAFGNLDPDFLGKSYDPKNEYSVPLFWGTTGVGYNKKSLGSDVDSWAALFEPKNSGKILMLNDPRELLAAALRKAGKDVNERDPAVLDAAKAELKRQNPLVLLYETDTFAEKLLAGDVAIAQGFNGQFAKVIKQKPDELRFVVPKEGGTLWIDNLCVPTAARRAANAHAFIDYLMRPEIAARLANYAAYASANKAARPKIDPARLNDPVVYPPADVLARCAVMQDLGATNKTIDTLMADIKGK